MSENVPLTMTFFKIGDSLIVDPDRDEEDSADARLTLAISKPGKDKVINSMQKGEITPLSCDDLNDIIKGSEEVYDKVFPEVDKKIKKLKK